MRRSMSWRRCYGRSAPATASRSSGFLPMAVSLQTTTERASSRRKFRRCEPRPLPDGRGISPRLGQHLPEPFVEIHPDDAIRYGVSNGSFARVTTDFGQCTLKVVVSERQQRGMLFAPIHWSEQTASAARIGALVAPITDPFSGQPENKATPVSIVPYEYVFRGFALSRLPLQLPAHVWWSRVTVAGGYGYLFADNAD